MTLITLVAKIIADERTEEILFDAMRSATKVYNGLIWQLREQYEQTGTAPISRKNLNHLMKTLPRGRAAAMQLAYGLRTWMSPVYTLQLGEDVTKNFRPIKTPKGDCRL